MAWRAERRNSKSTCCVTLTTAAPEKTSARLEFHYSPPREGKIQGSGNDLPEVLPSEAYPEVSSSLRRHFLQSCAFLAAKFFISISSTCPPHPRVTPPTVEGCQGNGNLLKEHHFVVLRGRPGKTNLMVFTVRQEPISSITRSPHPFKI